MVKDHSDSERALEPKYPINTDFVSEAFQSVSMCEIANHCKFQFQTLLKIGKSVRSWCDGSSDRSFMV